MPGFRNWVRMSEICAMRNIATDTITANFGDRPCYYNLAWLDSALIINSTSTATTITSIQPTQ